MALSPKDMELSTTELYEANKLEKEIDGKLSELPPPRGESTIKIRIGRYKLRLVMEVIGRYTAVGWKEVTFDDQEGVLTFKN